MDAPDPSSEQLLSAAAAGRPAAFEQLVVRHEGSLMARFRSQGLDEEAARDCAQETFLRLHRAAGSYEPRAPFGAFLALLARHVLVDWRRRRHRRQDQERPLPLGFEDELSAEAPRGVEPLDLVAALARLPEAQRGVVELRFAEGLELASIAARLQIPVGTVKSRLHHALQRLRGELR